ncbi:MAG: DUF4345 family protein [Xanthomonadales bacterium]|nr:hypothetical protein [Xanthomonadales bacterium]MCC6594562.1 DUF4345 family protein [Xanthomonadales bacterium]MCE7931008.1 DUF4345 domain-containing protein [Xanthomonadales bacterium PRO6]
MRIDNPLLAIGGVGFLAFGAWMLVAPQSAMTMVGLAVPDGAAATEIRAFYGGLELGLGALLLAAVHKVQYQRAGLVLGCVSYGSIGGARLLGMAVDRDPSAFLWLALVIELGLAAGYWWRLRTGKRVATSG